MACLPAALEVRSLRGVVDGEALPEMGKKIGKRSSKRAASSRIVGVLPGRAATSRFALHLAHLGARLLSSRRDAGGLQPLSGSLRASCCQKSRECVYVSLPRSDECIVRIDLCHERKH